MPIRAVDRVTGIHLDLPQGELIASRYRLLPVDRVLAQNTLPVSAGDSVVPDADGRWVVRGGSESAEGLIDRAQLPDPRMDARGLITVGRQVHAALEAGISWEDLVAISPLESDMPERAEVLHFERRLAQRLGHLEDVCARPRVKLSVETERVPVSRARRLARNAPNYLASHAEDWERLTLRSVLPRRILAVVRHDEYDIYENRVAVRLVDRLSFYLAGRIREVKGLARVFQEAHDFNSDVGRGTFRRRHRLLELWGRATDADRALDTAEKTLVVLESLIRRVNALKDSLLYRQVPPQAEVSVDLKVTNVLNDDPRYRRVADLWRDWARNAWQPTLPPAERYAQWQELNRSFDLFAMLAVAIGLHQLGFRADGRTSLSTFPVVELRRGEECLNLARDPETGVIEVHRGAERLFRVVPLCAYLAQLGDTLIEPLLVTADRAGGTLVVYPDAPGPRSPTSKLDVPHLRLETLGHETGEGHDGRAGFIAISPRSLGSVERIARFARWATESPAFAAYPPRVPKAGSVQGIAIAGWAEVRNGDLVVRALPPPGTVERVREDAARVRERLAGLRSESDVLADRVARAQRAGRPDREATRRKQATDEEIVVAAQSAAELGSLVDGLERAMPVILTVATCRICHTADRPDFRWSDERRFDATCPRCEARWSLNRCSRCTDWVPVLVPHYKVEELDADATVAGWVDRMFGADVLAPPRLAHGALRYICPTCGQETA